MKNLILICLLSLFSFASLASTPEYNLETDCNSFEFKEKQDVKIIFQASSAERISLIYSAVHINSECSITANKLLIEKDYRLTAPETTKTTIVAILENPGWKKTIDNLYLEKHFGIEKDEPLKVLHKDPGRQSLLN